MEDKDAQISRMECEIEFLKIENENLHDSVRLLKDETSGLQKRICLQDKRMAEMESKQEADINRLQNRLQDYISNASSSSSCKKNSNH